MTMDPNNSKQASSTFNSTRILYLDHLRAFLIVLVVLGHSAFAYAVSLPNQWSINPEKIIVCDVIILLGNVFFMITFFLISGYFSLLSLQKKSVKNFLKQRFVRLGIPLIVGLLFINPSISYIRHLVKDQQVPSYIQYWFTVYLTGKIDFEHLWFLLCLIIFSIMLCVIFVIEKNMTEFVYCSNPKQLSSKILLSFALFCGLIFFAVNIFVSDEKWFFFGGIQPTRFVLYTAYFFLGVSAFKYKWFSVEKRFDKILLWAISALLLTVSLLAFYTNFYFEIERSILLMFFRAMLWSFLGLSIFMTLIRIFHYNYDRPSRLWQKISDNAYAIYIIHLPVIVILQYLLIKLPLLPFVKFMIVFFAGLIISYLMSEYLIHRIPIVKNII